MRFARDYENAPKNKADAELRASYDGARKLGVDGAPSLYLDGVLVGGSVEYPELRGKIDAALRRAASPSPARASSASSFDTASPAWR